ncbi:site-specific integrase [Candidatus Macondimonas diazotrophica]|jgi:integrase|nr:site-specific integrase [Candidatus Macondimonas diazotrophica]
MAAQRWPRGIDPHGRGIRIRLWRGGRLAWTETVPGDPYRASDLASAVRRREELQARLKLGLPLYRGDATATARSLFIDAAQDYLNALDADHSTHLSYENILNRYWLPAFGGWPVDEISTAEIQKRLAGWAVSQKTKKNLLIPLRGVLGHAGVNPNPVAAVRLKRHQKPPILRYRPEEVSALLSALRGQDRLYFAVLFGTGLRPGEALALQWSDYNGEELFVHRSVVRRRLKATTKTHSARRVVVPTWVRTLLRATPTRFAGGYIFVNTKGRHYRDTDVFNAAWQEAHRRTRIPYRIPYTCRHTRAAELLSTGVEPGDAAKQLGHTVEMFLRTYSEWIEEYQQNRDKARFDGIGVKIVDG